MGGIIFNNTQHTMATMFVLIIVTVTIVWITILKYWRSLKYGSIKTTGHRQSTFSFQSAFLLQTFPMKILFNLYYSLYYIQRRRAKSGSIVLQSHTIRK